MIPASQARSTYLYHNGTTVIEITYRFFLLFIEFEVCSIGGSSCPLLWTWSKAVAGEVLSTQGEPTTSVLLNGLVVKLPSKYLRS